MFKKVHFLLGLFVALYFMPYVNNKIVFFPIVLISTFIPDFDLIISPRRRKTMTKPSELRGYRDFMHSYTLCIILSALLAIFYPILALPFFIGYSFHLFFDSLTTYGISPFWPFKIKTKGFISPDGIAEKTITIILILLTLLLVFRYLF